jgi:hypothetical protein
VTLYLFYIISFAMHRTAAFIGGSFRSGYGNFKILFMHSKAPSSARSGMRCHGNYFPDLSRTAFARPISISSITGIELSAIPISVLI